MDVEVDAGVDIELPKTHAELEREWFDDAELAYFNQVGSASLLFLAKKLEVEYSSRRSWNPNRR